MADWDVVSTAPAPGADPWAVVNTTPAPAAPQYTGLWRLPAMAGQGLVEGAANVLGMPGDLANLIIRYGENPLRSALGVPTNNSPSIFPTSADLLADTKSFGITGSPSLTPGAGPNPLTEKYLAAGAEGVGGAVPFLATGGAAAPLLLGGGAGGLAAEATHQALPNSKVLPILAGAAAGGGVQAGVSSLAGNVIDRLAGTMGRSASLQEAGTVAQKVGSDWLTNVMPAKEAAAWAPVDAAIPPATPTPITNLESALTTITGKGGSLAKAVKALRPVLPDRLLDIIQNLSTSGLGVPPAWQDVRELRSAIGQAVDYPSIVSSIGQQNVKRLYAAITDDLGDVAKAQGAGDEWSAANATSRGLNEFKENTLAKIMENPQPERAMAPLLTGSKIGGTTLGELRREMPDAVDELAAAYLRNPTIPWNKMSSEAKVALIPDSGMRQKITEAYRSGGTSNTGKSMLHTLQSTLGLGAGSELGITAGSMLHLPGSDLLHGALGGLTGMALPPALRLGAQAVRNPSLLRIPAAGAVAGSNPLLP